MRSAQDKQLRVLALSSSAAALRRLEASLTAPGLRLEGHQASLSGAQELAESYDSDLVVVDLAGRTALGEVEWASIAALSRTAPSLALVSPGSSELRERLLRAGVLGILPADAGTAELVAAIQAASRGLVVVHPNLLGKRAGPVDQRGAMSDELPEESPAERLTPREIEVLQMIAEGYSNKEIAGLLGISDHTVKFHASSILSKLGVSSRTEATIEGVRQGLVVI